MEDSAEQMRASLYIGLAAQTTRTCGGIILKRTNSAAEVLRFAEKARKVFKVC
jgi:hypothetical protein